MLAEDQVIFYFWVRKRQNPFRIITKPPTTQPPYLSQGGVIARRGGFITSITVITSITKEKAKSKMI